MRHARSIVMGLIALAATVSGIPTATAASDAAGPPVFTPLGPLDANVLSMSADGSILVGTDIFGSSAFSWTPRRGTQLLGPGGGQVSISRDGSSIVGDVEVHGQHTAAQWRRGTVWRSVGGYPGSAGCGLDLSNAFAVADGGSVVVGLGWDGCHATGFRWEASTGMVSLGSLDGFASRANDVNADGSVIVGWDDAPDGSRRGARWVDGVESLLATGEFLGGAEAVTPNGAVIVGGEAGSRGNQAYRWSERTGARLLGKLPGGGLLSRAVALALTDDGEVVVGFSGAQFRDAFVWTSATGMVKLQDYLVGLGVTGLDGWQLDTALAISSDGTKIAGWGVNPDGRVQSWLVEHLPPFSSSG
jgi:uncharacterized membrane protein